MDIVAALNSSVSNKNHSLVTRQVEDIVDTGRTLSCLISYLEKKGASSVSVCSLIDKPSRRKVEVKLVGNGKFYIGFEVCLSF
jgi:hypoxanthine-guanine phosphoribosyltransferase